MSYKGQKLVPPPTSGWSWYNQQSSTATTIDNNAINFYTPKHGSANADDTTGYYRTAPSTPYTIIANLTYNGVDRNSTTGLVLTPGLGFSNGTTSSYINPRIYDTGYGLCVTYWSVHGTANSNDFNDQPATATPYPWSTTQWMMIRDDGTNVYYYMSNDNQENGKSWVKILSYGRNVYDIKANVGVFWNGRGNVDINCTINSWQVLAV